MAVTNPRPKQDLKFSMIDSNAFKVEFVCMCSPVSLSPDDVLRLMKAEGTETIDNTEDGTIYCNPEKDLIEFIDYDDEESVTLSYFEFLQYLALIGWIDSTGL